MAFVVSFSLLDPNLLLPSLCLTQKQKKTAETYHHIISRCFKLFSEKWIPIRHSTFWFSEHELSFFLFLLELSSILISFFVSVPESRILSVREKHHQKKNLSLDCLQEWVKSNELWLSFFVNGEWRLSPSWLYARV